MKQNIHPDYQEATVNCACGATVETRSTRGSFSTDVCSQCHPFYTGKHKVMDVAGRVDRFRRRYAGTAGAAAPAAAEPTETPKSS